MIVKLLQRIALVFPLLFSAGCATQAHWDAQRLRQHALDYYSDQIVDNLIRASNGQLFLHVNIAGLNASVEADAGGSFEGGQSLTRSSDRQITAAVLTKTLANAATRPLGFSLSGSVKDHVDYNTIPVVEDAQSYIPYLQFLNLKDPKQRLRNVKNYDVNVDKPIDSIRRCEGKMKLVSGEDYLPGTLRKWNGNSYYIPMEYRQAYFDLCLALVGSVEASGPSAATGKGASTTPPTSKMLRLPPSPVLKQLKRNEQTIQQLRSLLPL